MEIVAYEPRHLDPILALCKAEGWMTFAGNRDRAARAMSEPGVTALVAVDDGRADRREERVLGFSQAVGDGAFGGYLCMLLVAKDARGRGIGKALVERTLVESGVLRLDLLSSEDAMSLYERFPHNRIPGFRLYPDESLRPPEATLHRPAVVLGPAPRRRSAACARPAAELGDFGGEAFGVLEEHPVGGAGVESGELADQAGWRRHGVRAAGVAAGRHQGAEHRGLLLGQREADLPAHRPADQGRLDEPERFDQVAGVAGHQRHRDRPREVVGGVADAAIVEDRHPEVPRQRVQQVGHPEAHRRGVALDHDQVGPVAELAVADLDPVDGERVDRPLEGAGARGAIKKAARASDRSAGRSSAGEIYALMSTAKTFVGSIVTTTRFSSRRSQDGNWAHTSG